jgi:transposase-like protein
MDSNGLKRALAVLALGGATLALGGAAVTTVSAQATATPETGPSRADRQAQHEQFLSSVAAKLNVTVDQLKQAMQQTRQELGFPGHGPGGPGGPNHPGGPAGPGGRGMGLEAAAQAIGIDANQLRQEIPGKSLADVARAHNVDPSTVANAIKNQVTARIDQAVTAGRLSADQANQMKQNIDRRIDQQINRQVPANIGQERGRARPDNAPTQGNAPTRGFQPQGTARFF